MTSATTDNTKSSSQTKGGASKPKPWYLQRKYQVLWGLLLVVFSFVLTVSLVSYWFTGKADQSLIHGLFSQAPRDTAREADNWAGLFGALIAYFFSNVMFGLAALVWVPWIFLKGSRILLRKEIYPLSTYTPRAVFWSLFVPIAFSALVNLFKLEKELGYLTGFIPYELFNIVEELIGVGIWLFLPFVLAAGLMVFYGFSELEDFIPGFVKRWAEKETRDKVATQPKPGPESLISKNEGAAFSAENVDSIIDNELGADPPGDETDEQVPDFEVVMDMPEKPLKAEPEFEIQVPEREQANFEIEHLPEPEPAAGTPTQTRLNLLERLGNYDPKEDLPNFRYPEVDYLKAHDSGNVEVNNEELKRNGALIIETLESFGVKAAISKATIGPTVTLYEIVPDAGVKIAKIKNLEDDIALKQAALGIRIIAPMPGKGTIGIEVPNKQRMIVSMRSLVNTAAFEKSNAELPVVLGKNISNEVAVIDLAKMPHLLVAGATGQGKSVGLNVIITSLLYKKHPGELKFVMVDPKKVELSIYSKLEKHYLAKLPDGDEPIITDTRKVVHTLNSLTDEMDMRYGMLKEAGCRNIKEYNQKFKERGLNPERGHRFLPYIILIIDELADLMMTAGKEVETPIARLAQLARAVGIHLVVATQRPSVNVITGIIKANFPARLSFKVTQKVDSRTILDTGGAEQLVGMGDMLLSVNSEVVRLQCAFLDTPEVERIVTHISDQRGYSSAYMLPEVESDDGGNEPAEYDASELDKLFEEAARIVVNNNLGSTSLIQRKLKLGYARAGRIMDQLHHFGIVGQQEGSKTREVLITDLYQLEQLLRDIKEKG